MKILLIGEYSGLHKELKSALLSQGHEVTLAAASDFWKKFDADISLGHGDNIFSYKLRQLILPLAKLKSFVGFDVVHIINFYIIPRLPALNLFMVRFLKENNKLVTLSGSGDDPFFVRFSEQTMRYSPIPNHERYDRMKPYYMRKESHINAMHDYMGCVDGVIPIMYEYFSTFNAAGYSKKTSPPIPIPINCTNIKFKENTFSERLVLFHGLNRPGFKGTFLIEKVFAELTKKYPNKLECIIEGKMPFEKYMQVIAKTNVSVDQVFSYSLAMNALYSMAQGKVVAGGGEQESSILYHGALPPVINLLPDESSMFLALKDYIEQVLDDRCCLSERAIASREFVIRHHSPDLVAKAYIDYWSGLS